MNTGIKVGDVMKTSLVTISADKSIFDAARLMKDHQVGSLIVTSESVSILTQGDLVEKALATKHLDVKVGALASKRLFTISAELDLADAASLMGKHKVKRLLVTKGSQDIVGIISSTDIIRISPSLYDLISEHERLKTQ
ncbi:CBS domain-containing protein [Candidatus Micrarchaeota archaeon]|nr:CBS domain-containing protein [Candidatus Micrarchaeota archaeon]